MATDLNGTTADYGTQNLVGATGETLPAVVQAQMSDNTGFNWYTPHMLSKQTDNIIAARTTDTDSHYAFMAQGTYIVWASAYFEQTGVYVAADCYVQVDGTSIIQEEGAPFTGSFVTGSAEVIVGSDSWVFIEYKAKGADAANESTTRDGAVYFRRNER